jgi:uncharacterized membrane-anchored protein
MKALVWSAFAAAVIAQWAVPLVGVMQHERTLNEGVPVRLRCAAPDPYDMLRGRFLAVNLPNTVPRPASLKDREFHAGQPIFLLLERDADGLHKVAGVTLERPAEEALYVKASVRWHWRSSDEIGIVWPVDRYYLNEKLAPEADKWYAETVRDSDGVIAELRVLEGRLVIEDLTYKGTPFREILRAVRNE